MALLFPPSPSFSSCAVPSSSGFHRRPPSNPFPNLSHSKTPSFFPSLPSSELISKLRSQYQFRTPIFTSSSSPFARNCIKASTFSWPTATESTTDFSTASVDSEQDGEEEEVEEGAGSPWEGAVVYRRDASVTHLEYCTTLERLGLGKLSTDMSRSRASAMGIRLTTATRRGGARGDSSSPSLLGGNPVLISVDVTRKKRRLKLDGILRTVITLGCNRCAGPATECVFSNFTLLLTEEPIEEPEEISMGVIYSGDKCRDATTGEGEEDEDERLIELDDRLHFPPEEKEIDISKHIRDIVHVEITINAICDAGCKGLCLNCGANLNKSGCSCNKEPVDVEQGKDYGPLKNLRKQMQQR